MITRNNYEEFFLLYADNELPAPVKKAVEEFVQENTDLAEELLKLQEAVLVPDNHIVFENKAALLKPTAGASFINDVNYEAIFVLYTDFELDEAGKKEVELFADQHPSYAEALALLQQTRMEPDMNIVFENKAILYRKEEKDKVILLPWFRIAAAAIVLLLLGLYVFNHTKTTTGTLVTTDNKKNSNPENKNEQVAVTSAGTHPLDTIEGTKKNTTTADVKSTDRQTAKADADRRKKGTAEDTKSTGLQATELTSNNDMPKPTTLAAVDVTNNPGNNTASARLAASTLNDVPNKQLVAKTDNRTDVEEKTQEINYIQQHLQEENAAASNTIFFVASSSAKKSKLRGIFRKVSRVFDKEASADDDNNKRGVLIGSFQIALK